MTNKQKKTGEPKTKTPHKRESKWIQFIKQEPKATIPFLADSSGNPVVIPFAADASEYEAIPEKNPFQAHLPRLSTKNDYASDQDNLKWYGTKIWPRNEPSQETNYGSNQEGSSEPNNEVLENEDHSVLGGCKCERPGSLDCIHRHMKEERKKLKAELGPAFRSWKFDEMGDKVADSWNLMDMIRFIRVINKRNHPSSQGKSFMELAQASLPRKSTASIVSYYFNFYLPSWRIRKRTKYNCTGAEIDTDDDGPSWKSCTRAGVNVDDTSTGEAVQNKFLIGRR